MIEAQGLVKRFGTVTALDGVDLLVPGGSVLGLLGPNGAGKTTAVRVLATLVRPDAGRARVAGLDVMAQAGAVRRLIGLSGQFAAVDSYLSGRENLTMIARLARLSRGQARRRTEELLEGFDLISVADRQARGYSGGMRRRLDVAASVVARPRVLFLDEPTTGLDPASRIAVWQLLGELVADGTAVLLTTQYLEEADRLADQITVLDAGHVIAHGTAAELKSHLGGDRLELRASPGGLDRLADAVAALASGPIQREPATGRLTVPVTSGSAVLPDLARALAAAQLDLDDLAIRRPTLDDVFLSLTGHGAHAAGSTGASAAVNAATGPAAAPFGRVGGDRMNATLASVENNPKAVLQAVQDVIVVTGRNLRRLVRVPTLLVFATVQPVLFVLLFTYAFGGAIHVPAGHRYIDYLLPGLVVLAIGFGASQTGVAIADDLTSGMIDRLRSLPASGAAVLLGRVAADAIRNLFVVCLMTAIAATLGFQFHTHPRAVLAAAALAIAVGVVFSWLNLLLGLAVRDAESAGLRGLFPVIILIFTSSTLVPIHTMPGWLQAFAAHQPVTVTVDALRALCLGGPTARPVLAALAWVAALLALTVPVTLARYRTAAPAG